MKLDALARPKDDLFEDSTMTIGEHLEELRKSLVKALLWLAAGLSIGLLVANHVVRYVQTPLQEAIVKYRADRDMSKFGWDNGDDPDVAAFKGFLMEQALVAELVYEMPADLVVPSLQKTVDAGDNPLSSTEAATGAEVIQSLERLPDPASLKPRLQLRRSQQGLSSLKVEEPFMIWVKAGLIVGAVLASPMIFYHIWSFVAAGLHSHERRYVYVYLPVSVILFSSGVGLAFFVVLKYVLTFFLTFNDGMDVNVEPRLTYYINFVLLLPLGFGVAFQLPLVMLFLQRIDLIKTEDYIKSWRVATLVIFVVAMIATPADVTSMIALAIPLLALYFVGIAMCQYMPRGRGLGSGAYDPA